MSISTRETEKDVTSLTSLGDEESALVADTGASPIKDSIQQVVPKVVWQAGNKLPTTN